MPAYTIQNTIKGPFTKDVRGEGSRGVSEIRTNLDIGRGGGLIQQPGHPSLKKNKNKKHVCFCGIKRY